MGKHTFNHSFVVRPHGPGLFERSVNDHCHMVAPLFELSRDVKFEGLEVSFVVTHHVPLISTSAK